MWEGIIEIIKVILDKQPASGVFSLVCAFFLSSFLPTNNCLIKKMGRIGCFLFVAGLIFLMIRLLAGIYCYVCDRVMIHNYTQRRQKQQKSEFQEELNVLWRDYDSFSPEAKELINKLVDNENKPVEIGYQLGSLRNEIMYSEWFISTVIEKNGYRVIKGEYKLEPYVYEKLKYSIDTYGRISNFE